MMKRMRKENVWNNELNLTTKSHRTSVDVQLGMRDCQLVHTLSPFDII